MSYINDALRKVQKEKESGYAGYERIVSAPGKESNRQSKWMSVIGLLTVIFFAAGIMVVLYFLEYKNMPAKAPLTTAPLTSVIPANLQIVKEDPELKAGFKEKTTAAEIKVKPKITDSKILYAQALKKQREGKIEEAKDLYKKVVKIDPHNIQALNNLGVIYMKKKTYKWAIIRLNDALKIKYNYSDAHYNLACIYAQKNDVSQSLFYLKNAIRFNPEARNWAKNDSDLKALANLTEFKKLLEK